MCKCKVSLLLDDTYCLLLQQFMCKYGRDDATCRRGLKYFAYFLVYIRLNLKSEQYFFGRLGT